MSWRRRILFGGRRGQIMQIDVYDNPSGNYNVAVAGTSGSGKSLLLNEIAAAYLGTGARVWIIDVGRSYEKACRNFGGSFIEFTEDAALSLNPFPLVEDIDEDMELLQPLLAQMVSPRELPDLVWAVAGRRSRQPLPQHRHHQLLGQW